MSIVYRKAVPEDTAACLALRGQTRENAFSAPCVGMHRLTA